MIANRLKIRFGINTLLELIRFDSNLIFLERQSIYRQIPNVLLAKLIENQDLYFNSNVFSNKNICVGLNKWIAVKKLNSMLIRNLISNNHDENIDSNFVNIKKITMNTQLRDFQFKLLHGIINTRHKLFKFKYVDNQNCLTCLENNILVKDDIMHSLVACPVSAQTWINFATFYNNKLGLTMDIDPQEILSFFRLIPKNKIVNETAIHIKKLLHKPMSIRKVISLEQIEKIHENLMKLINCINSMKINKKF